MNEQNNYYASGCYAWMHLQMIFGNHVNDEFCGNLVTANASSTCICHSLSSKHRAKTNSFALKKLVREIHMGIYEWYIIRKSNANLIVEIVKIGVDEQVDKSKWFYCHFAGFAAHIWL